jgi:hypothetical protein
MEFTLDCESKESVFNSLCKGFICTHDSLKNILLELDIEKIYHDNWKNIDIPSDEYLFNYVTKRLGNHKPLKEVNWFHLTRTTKENEFTDGIIPLGASLERIWPTLINIAPDAVMKNNLKLLKENGVPNSLYQMKHNDSFHWGPYAVLVKETAFRSSIQHDYLGMPEIIEDICNGYEEKYGESIINIYKSSLVPKIVKFKSNKRVDTGCIEAALYYAYEAARGDLPSSNCITCFDSEGVKIEPESIVSVSTVEILPQ